MLKNLLGWVLAHVRAAWGARILDAVDRRWSLRVDEETLDSSRSASCVIGQVLGGLAGYFTNGSLVLDGADPSSIEGRHKGVRRGFVIGRFSAWGHLDAAWKYQIRRRNFAAFWM